MDLKTVTDQLVTEVERLRFSAPVTHVYNPLVYARKPYDRYLELYGAAPKQVVLVGMNPGPFGMAQTGVPFGDVAMVRDWLGVSGPVDKPDREHPKRPVQGYGCPRSEVSGTRLWGWARDLFGTPDRFFSRFFVANYCPLCFMEESGRNRTPDKLAPEERKRLFAACDRALRRTIDYLQPSIVLGVGKFAESRAVEALSGLEVTVGTVLHPSPASPAANRGWAQAATKTLESYGIEV